MFLRVAPNICLILECPVYQFLAGRTINESLVMDSYPDL